MSLKATIYAGIDALYAGSNAIGAQQFTLAAKPPIQIKSGTGNGNADLLYAAQRQLAPATSETLDLAGVLSDAFGATLIIAKVKAIYIRGADANSGNIEVGGAAANAFIGPLKDVTDIAVVQPGGVWLNVAPNAGWTVTPATGDLLKVNNPGAAAGTYDIIVVGASA